MRLEETRRAIKRIHQQVNELFDTNGLFTLQGNQPVQVKRFEKPEPRTGRLIKLPRPTVDELYDRFHKTDKED